MYAPSVLFYSYPQQNALMGMSRYQVKIILCIAYFGFMVNKTLSIVITWKEILKIILGSLTFYILFRVWMF